MSLNANVPVLPPLCRAADKLILERAYKANAKPDKFARQEIVNQVSLNEKEVQARFSKPARSRMCSTSPSHVLTLVCLADMVSEPAAERPTQVAAALSPRVGQVSMRWNAHCLAYGCLHDSDSTAALSDSHLSSRQ
jgi:hypothetical protein